MRTREAARGGSVALAGVRLARVPLAGVAALAALAACASDGSPVGPGPRPSTTDATGAASPSALPPDVAETPSARASGPPSASLSAPPPGDPSEPPAAGGGASATATFPPTVALEHGDRVSAVYLAVARASDDPELEQARQSARDVGYGAVGGGEVDCDQGAREQLGLAADRPYYTVALYFADRATAQQFVDAYEPGVVGTADVQVFCLD